MVEYEFGQYQSVQNHLYQNAFDRFSKAFPGSHGVSDDPDEKNCNVIKFPNVR